jgi:peroxiredoxin
MWRWWLAGLLIVLIAGDVAWRFHRDRGTSDSATASADDAVIPTTLPTLPTIEPAKSSAAAAPLLEQFSGAYRHLKSLALTGTSTLDTDVGGKKTHEENTFTSHYLSPIFFSYTDSSHLAFGSTGSKVYVLGMDQKQYYELPAVAPPVNVDDYPNVILQLLSQDDPSLQMALSLDPADELTFGMSRVDRGRDVKIDGVGCPTLVLTSSPDEPSQMIALDPTTHLIRQVSADVKNALEQQGVADVRSATLVVRYKTIAEDAPLAAAGFAWTPPAGAQDITADDSELSPMVQVGKPAPDFSLPDISGKTVNLSQFKGHVIVLDFWGTACPPCLASMPHLDELHAQMAPLGVDMLAINAQETPAMVRSFLARYPKLITFPILMDVDGSVTEKYQAESLPTTIVIDRGGTIVRVFVGISARGEQPLHREIEKLLK